MHLAGAGGRPWFAGTLYDANRKMIGAVDAPALGSDTFAGLFSSMDATFQARMYLVWKYDDGTIYSLARADWQAVFQAATSIFGLQLTTNSVVSKSPMVVSNADPGKVVGPVYNSFMNLPPGVFWVSP